MENHLARNALICDADLHLLAACDPELGMKPFTPQQEQLMMFTLRGLPPSAAAKAVGMSAVVGARLLSEPRFQAALDLLREREFDDVEIDRNKVTQMFLEAFDMAASSQEMTGAAKELGKLHGLYKSDAQSRTQININTQNNTQNMNVRHIQSMDDDELAVLAGGQSMQAPEAIEHDPLPETEEVIDVDPTKEGS